MKKKLPILKTDEEAEKFVATADLSEYDLSSFKKSILKLSRRMRPSALGREIKEVG